MKSYAKRRQCTISSLHEGAIFPLSSILLRDASYPTYLVTTSLRGGLQKILGKTLVSIKKYRLSGEWFFTTKHESRHHSGFIPRLGNTVSLISCRNKRFLWHMLTMHQDRKR